jgi:hypothetical protein
VWVIRSPTPLVADMLAGGGPCQQVPAALLTRPSTGLPSSGRLRAVPSTWRQPYRAVSKGTIRLSGG